MNIIWTTKDKVLVYTGVSATIDLGEVAVNALLSKQVVGDAIITEVNDEEFYKVVDQVLKRHEYSFINREAVSKIVGYIENSFDDISSNKDFYDAYLELVKNN